MEYSGPPNYLPNGIEIAEVNMNKQLAISQARKRILALQEGIILVDTLPDLPDVWCGIYEVSVMARVKKLDDARVLMDYLEALGWKVKKIDFDNYMIYVVLDGPMATEFSISIPPSLTNFAIENILEVIRGLQTESN